MGDISTNTLIEDIDSTGVVGKNLDALYQYLAKGSKSGLKKVYEDSSDESGAMWNPESGDSVKMVIKSLDSYIKHIAQRGEIEERITRIRDALKDLGLSAQ